MIEMRPRFGTPTVSVTKRLPPGVSIILAGRLNPPVNTDVVCAFTVVKLSASASARVLNATGVFFPIIFSPFRNSRLNPLSIHAKMGGAGHHPLREIFFEAKRGNRFWKRVYNQRPSFLSRPIIPLKAVPYDACRQAE